jgi:NDP-sugar pyrophosphorylase family protein
MVRFLAKHARDGDPRMNIRGSCIDPDADIRRASIIDSVVMKNAVVHDDVVVARSVVCEGTVIPRGTRVIDSIVGGASHPHLPGSSRGTR